MPEAKSAGPALAAVVGAAQQQEIWVGAQVGHIVQQQRQGRWVGNPGVSPRKRVEKSPYHVQVAFQVHLRRGVSDAGRDIPLSVQE